MSSWVEVVATAEEFYPLGDRYRLLAEKCQNVTPPMRWEWLRSWMEVNGELAREGGLAVLFAVQAWGPIGVLPWYVKGNGRIKPWWLGMIGIGEERGAEVYPEFLDLLALPGHEEDVLRVISEWIEINAGGDVYDSGLVADSALILRLPPFADAPGYMRMRREYPSPYADLSGGFEDYLKRLSSNARQQYRRLMRQGDAAGLRFEEAQSPTEVDQFLEELFTLHQSGWKQRGERGAFADERVRKFYRSISQAMHPRGLMTITRLRTAQSATAAVQIGFRAGEAFHFYQSGMDSSLPELRPGILLHLHTMQFLAARGVTSYEFLAGESDYKSRMATGSRRLVRVRAFAIGPRGMLALAAEGCRVAWARARKQLASRKSRRSAKASEEA